MYRILFRNSKCSKDTFDSLYNYTNLYLTKKYNIICLCICLGTTN